MEIGSSQGLQGLWDLTSPSKVNRNDSRTYRDIQGYTTYSGDSVDISDEARKLYSEMIHKYDKATSSEANDSQQASQSGSGAGGLDSSSSLEAVKKQIESLKSQIASLTSQMGKGADSAAMSKMNALESQLAALEAQLHAMEAAA